MLPVLFQVGIGFGGFSSMVSNLQSMGFFQLVFPFLLALAIFYGVLSTAFKGKMPNSAIGLISLIFSFFVMLYSSANPGIVGFLQNVSGGGLIVGAGILFLVIVFGLMGWDVSSFFKPADGKKDMKWVFPLALLAIVLVVVFGAGGGWLLPGVSISGDFMTFLFFIAILVVVLTFLNGGGGGGDAHGGDAGHGAKH